MPETTPQTSGAVPTPPPSPKPKRKRRWLWRVLLGIVLLAVILHLPVGEVKIQPGPDTTVLTGPLNPDGTVDYVAALNTEDGNGVTSENNAAVLIAEALGGDFLPYETREESLRMMGMPTALDPCGVFVTWENWARRRLPAESPLRPAAPSPLPPPMFGPFDGPPPATPNTAPSCGPVPATPNVPPFDGPPAAMPNVPPSATPQEPYREPPDPRDILDPNLDANAVPPEFRQWMADNAAALDKLVAASRRPRFYLPVVSTTDPPCLLNVPAPTSDGLREARQALVERAVLRALAGDQAGAAEDLLASYRLARHLGRSSFFLLSLSALGLEETAAKATCNLVTRGLLTGEPAQELREALGRMGPAADIARTLDRSERRMVLDVVAKLYRGGEQDGWEELRTSLDVDWNYVLRRCDRWYGGLVAAMRQKTRAQRQAALLEWSKQAEELSEDAPHSLGSFKAWMGVAKIGGWATRRWRSRILADHLSCILLPGLGRARFLQDTAEAYRQMAISALALAQFRVDHGRYPAALDKLVPDYVPAVPTDPLADQPLRYRTSGVGYVLYSIGHDATDDGGVVGEDMDQGDYVVRGR